MAPRSLKLSALACMCHLASVAFHRRRPRQASRVRAFAANPRTTTSRSRGPLIPAPRRPIDSAPMQVLEVVLSGLRRLAVAT
ncbi:hypothetical protein KGD82_00625 [Nocardiopsis eucommiae]|uniref:Uncharacterized protein n=1 Tax=Nocardiopsis eucommiae TaxID=2831970 RepID=A0A975QKM2_9ACTN|nr:hypothetical protein KGD82_00625 [Nocardiopsis eucommiae]